VYRQKLDNELVPTSKQEIVLIDENAQWHIAKPLSFDNTGNMYVPYGAPSNACASYISTTGNSIQQVGQNPCPELIIRAGIWKFKANALNQTQKDGTQLGTGLRSIVAMDWNKQTNTLFAVQHGRDDLHLLWPQYYSAWDNAVTPAEELFEINENSNYGWPYSYYDALTKQKLQAPEYSGDGKKLAIDQNYTNPLADFPAHWAPNDLLQVTNSLIDIKTAHLLHFTDQLIEAPIHKQVTL
jgi:glucose/arabinose dehydrogenase